MSKEKYIELGRTREAPLSVLKKNLKTMRNAIENNSEMTSFDYSMGALDTIELVEKMITPSKPEGIIDVDDIDGIN